MSDTSSDNFYFASATIIPIFFLAITLQGPLYNNLIDKVKAGARALADSVDSDPSRKESRAVNVAIVTGAVAAAILLTGAFGEFLAIKALYQPTNDKFTRSFVYWSVAGLIFLTVAGPAWALGRSWAKLLDASITGIIVSGKNVIAIFNRKNSKDSVATDTDANVVKASNDHVQQGQLPDTTDQGVRPPEP